MLLKFKKGDYKYYQLIALLLAVIVMSIVFIFFNELFLPGDIDQEVCRQSIYLRANLPEISTLINIASLKDNYPLKCKNNVITIDYEDLEKVEKTIAEELARCWFLFGNGKFNIFPSAVWTKGDSYCVMCSRIHFSPRVREYYTKNKVSMKNILNNPFLEYNSLIRYFSTLEKYPFFRFQWSDSFEVIEGGTNYDLIAQTASIKFVNELNMDNGDLYILFSQLIWEETRITSERKDNNKLYFLQEKSLPELEKSLHSNILNDFKICKYWDGIPA